MKTFITEFSEAKKFMGHLYYCNKNEKWYFISHLAPVKYCNECKLIIDFTNENKIRVNI